VDGLSSLEFDYNQPFLPVNDSTYSLFRFGPTSSSALEASVFGAVKNQPNSVCKD
jgi:hypothetical protein